MEPFTKFATLDDRYWECVSRTPCGTCKKNTSLAKPACSAYPKELPPKYWNAREKCPKREPIEPADQ